ncbi:MAG: flavodoxin family protein [Planctomycetota bacterium]|nr:MAG: flavodoxin family protein [Planctomycetota bacterium]
MKVIAFNGSPRKDGNTFRLLNYVLDELKNEGIETELHQLGGRNLHGCIACYKCAERKDRSCSVKTDDMNECIEKMIEADGIIIGSPTYFSNVTAEVKALIDRSGLVAKVNGSLFKRKLGAAVTAVRRAGSLHAFNSINHLFTINEMIIPGSCYWNMGIGHEKGDVEKDEEGIEIMKTLGRNMAWLLKKINE